MAAASPTKQPQHRTSKRPHHKKLARLPPNAHISKRPLLRPAIPSPHAGASQPKFIYISARTAFIPVIKRVEKLLAVAEKREVQSATTVVQQRKNQRGRGRGGFGGKGRGEDDILEIAEEVEGRRRDGNNRAGSGKKKGQEDGAGEQVVLKGTGKAVQKVLEFALWFQQRAEQYTMTMRTGSVGAIDDIEVNEGEPIETEDAEGGVEVQQDTSPSGSTTDTNGAIEGKLTKEEEPFPESRIRYTSSLEVSIRRK